MKNSRQPEQLFVPDNTCLEIAYDVNSQNKDTFNWNYNDDDVVV